MCSSPILVKRLDGSFRQVPCGRCTECLIAYQNAWKCRLMFERQKHPLNCHFVTLTYSDEHLPYLPSGSEGIEDLAYQPVFYPLSKGETVRRVRTYHTVYRFYRGDSLPSDGRVYTPSVCQSDVQNWIKRNRISLERSLGVKSLSKERGFKYFFTSEYGPKHLRPHYHGLLFGLTDSEVLAWAADWTDRYGRESCREVNVDIQKPRGDGVCDYVSKYCAKGFFEHPYCQKALSFASFLFDSQLSQFESEGFFVDGRGDKHYYFPVPPQNYGAAPRVLNTFHLVSKGLGLEFGCRHICSSLGMEFPSDFDSQDSKYMAKFKRSIQDYIITNYASIKSLSRSQFIETFDLSPTVEYVERLQIRSKNSDSAPFFPRSSFPQDFPVLSEAGFIVLNSARKFYITYTDKSGKPKTSTYQLPRYLSQILMCPSGVIQTQFAHRLRELFYQGLSQSIEQLELTGQGYSEALRVVLQRRENESLVRKRSSYDKFVKSQSNLFNSQLDV